MSDSIHLDEIDDPHHKPDFRRANGAPQIIDGDGKNQRFSRPSGWGHVLDDENALVNWKINRAIEGVAGDPALQARAAAAKPDDKPTWKQLREAAINAGRGDQGADIGTALHAMSERWEDPDDDFDPGEPYSLHLAEYTKVKEGLGLISYLTECHMVNVDLRAAGTADRLYVLNRELILPNGETLPVGTVVVGDLKTGKTLDFSAPGYAVQLAIYAGAKLYDVGKDEFIDTPEINQDYAIIIHMPSDRPECTAYWVDLEVGRWGAYLVKQVRDWRKNWRSGEFAIEEVKALMTAKDINEILPGTEVDLEAADAEWIEGNVEWVQNRLDQIKDHEEARKRLSILWPDTIPPKELRAGNVSVDQMLEALRLISRIEAEYELMFVTEGRPKQEGRDTLDPNVPPSQQVAEGATS